MFKLYTGRWIGTSNELSTSNLNSIQEHKEVRELLKIISVLLFHIEDKIRNKDSHFTVSFDFFFLGGELFHVKCLNQKMFWRVSNVQVSFQILHYAQAFLFVCLERNPWLSATISRLFVNVKQELLQLFTDKILQRAEYLRPHWSQCTSQKVHKMSLDFK